MLQSSFKSNYYLKCLTHCVIKRLAHIERKVSVNGIDINIVECGKGAKSVLLMPGALGSSWTDFKPQIQQLPQLLPHHKIIAWDPPGYGKSIPPKRQWGLDVFHNDARYAVDLMTTLGRPSFSIVGWSGGGITGLIAAGRYVQNIEKLIVCSAGAYLLPVEVKSFQNMRDVSQWSPRMREPMENLYGTERFIELWNEWVDFLETIYTQRKGDFCKQEVKQIKAATLIIYGNKDPIIAAEPVLYLRDNIQGAR